jgi:multimeric flavodoxin WrbA
VNIVAIGGSPRPHSNTNYLIDQALAELESRGIRTEKLILSQYNISPCYGHDDCGSLTQCRTKDEGIAILEKFAMADGVILASPVYMFTITAFMKIFMDRTYFFYTHDRPLKARVAGLIAIGGGAGADETITEMKKLVRPDNIKKFLVKGYTGEGDDVKRCPEIVESARLMGRQMAEELHKIKKPEMS